MKNSSIIMSCLEKNSNESTFYPIDSHTHDILYSLVHEFIRLGGKTVYMITYGDVVG